jgi:pleckstrin homology domain-containing family G member 4
MSLIGLTESVKGDRRRFEIWLNGRAEVHTFQAATEEIKGKWVTEIKKVLMNQLEELKDEKIKQYGNASHRYFSSSSATLGDA